MLAGAANESQTLSSIQKTRRAPVRPRVQNHLLGAESPDYQRAPNPSGFLLEALLQAHHVYSVDSTVAVSHLLDGLWASMVNDDKYYSGASWEYVKPDGSPGIDAFTSLAHPWGAAPSYVLPEYVLGIRPTSAGYKTFVVQPAVGVLGLKEVQGRVSTSYGTITASWELDGGRAMVDVDVPEVVDGIFEMPAKCMVEGNSDRKSAVMLSVGKNQLTLILNGSLN